MTPNRETLRAGLCVWIVLALLILARSSRWSWTATLAAIALALPVCLVLAFADARSEAREAVRRARLREEGRFEEAAERRADAFYKTGIAWGVSGVLGGLLLMGICAIGAPAAMPAALIPVGFGAWRISYHRRWWREEIEHRRTSAERLSSATQGLMQADWERERGGPA